MNDSLSRTQKDTSLINSNGDAFSNNLEYLRCLIRLHHIMLDEYGMRTVRNDSAISYDSLSLQKNLSKKIVNTRQAGIPLPVEELCYKFRLSHIDIALIRALLCLQIDYSLKHRYQKTFDRQHAIIGCVAEFVCKSLEERFALYQCFNKDSILLNAGLIICDDGRTGVDLLENRIHLPARIMDYATGNQGFFNNVMDMIKELTPDVTMESVVLPDDIVQSTIAMVKSYLCSLHTEDDMGLGTLYSFGAGLAMLFHGPSGTGKTMLAKAISNHFDMPLLTIDTDMLYHRNVCQYIYILYREARLRNGIVFFDECDDYFMDGSDLSNQLLKDIEEHPVVTIFTTNEPEKLDAALERRIMKRAYFPMPDISMRERIWGVHLPQQVKLRDDVDLKALASQYNISGGYIRNAVQMAVSQAMGRAAEGDSLVISMSDLMCSAEQQSASMMFDDDYKYTTALECPAWLSFYGLEKSTLSHFNHLVQSQSGIVMNIGNSTQKKIGIRILLQCPSFERGLAAANQIMESTGLKIFETDIEMVLRLLNSEAIDCSMSRSERKKQYDLFADIQKRPCALVVKDKTGLIQDDNQSLLATSWAELGTKLHALSQPLIYITTAMKLPRKSFNSWFHYDIRLSPCVAEERAEVLNDYLSNMNIFGVNAGEVALTIAELPESLFMTFLETLAFEAQVAKEPLDEKAFHNILSQIGGNCQRNDILFG